MYTARYGLVGRFEERERRGGPSRVYPRMGGFRTDPDFHLVEALEEFDNRTQTAAKAVVFHRRLISAPPTRVESLADALAASVRTHGHVDLRCVETHGYPPAAVVASGLCFEDPATGQWELAATYCSGDVRAKLDLARAAATARPEMAANVEALEAVLPPDLTPAEIQVRVGATWITADEMRRPTAPCRPAQTPQTAGHGAPLFSALTVSGRNAPPFVLTIRCRADPEIVAAVAAGHCNTAAPERRSQECWWQAGGPSCRTPR